MASAAEPVTEKESGDSSLSKKQGKKKARKITHQWQSKLVHSSEPIFEQLPWIDQVQPCPSCGDAEEGEEVRDDVIAYDDVP